MSSVILQLVVAFAVISIATRVAGALARRAAQPAVVGEIAAGILLGPSLLGALAPDASAALFPAEVLPPLRMLAEAGVVLFMFVVGIELDLAAVAGRARAAVAISSASIALPFGMGILLAGWLHPELAGQAGSLTVFALFVGVAMSVTAFPVLARILTDFGLMRAPIGAIAISAAAVGDAAAWCLLAVVAGLARAQADAGALTSILAAAYAAAMVVAVRPVIARLSARPASFARGLVLLGAMAASAMATHAIGIHALFGAFLVGAFVPAHSPIGIALQERLRWPIALLLPAFFAMTGLRTELRLIDGLAAWTACAAIFVVACAGKIGGAAAAARWAGLGARDAAGIGVLMNTRGLVELVVLTLGLDLGVISPALFAMLVLMALGTTAMTPPLLHALGWRLARDEAR